MGAAKCEISPEIYDKLVRVFKDANVMYVTDQIRARSPGIARSTAMMLASKESVVMREAADLLSPQQMDVLRQAWGSLAALPIGGKQAENKK